MEFDAVEKEEYPSCSIPCADAKTVRDYVGWNGILESTFVLALLPTLPMNRVAGGFTCNKYVRRLCCGDAKRSLGGYLIV